MADEEQKGNGRSHGFAISGSYLVNALLGLALAYIWSQFQASERLARTNEIAIVKLQAHDEHKESDIAEIKKNVRLILSKSHSHRIHASSGTASSNYTGGN